MATNTTQYNFQKPEVGADTDAWGDMLNANWDSTDSLLRGATALSNIGIGATNTTIPLVCNAASATDITATFSGKVGIGTTSPQALLHVQDTLGSPQIKINNEGTGSGIASLMFHGGGAGNPTSIIQSGGADSGNVGIIFKHGNNGSETERMRIDASGNVGIGTTSPYVKTEIIGGDLAVGGGAGASNLGLEIKGVPLSAIPSAQVRGYIATADSGMGVAGDLLIAPRTSVNASVRFITGTSPAERMRITSSGNVGIGETNPADKLQVTGGAVRIKSSYPRIYLEDTDNNSDYSIINNNGTFRIYDDTNGAYRMVIDTSGKVGIGTSSPNESLVVKGGTYAANQSGGMALQMGDTSGSHWQSSFKIKSDGSGNVRTTLDASTGAIGGQSQEVISINTSGNVGIGISNPSTALHVNSGTLDIAATIESSDSVVRLAFAESGSTGNNHISLDSNEWYIYSNSTERLRIDSSGNVGIGTSSPATRLDVKSKYSYQSASNGAIRIRNHNVDQFGSIFHIAGTQIVDNASYYTGGQHLAKTTFSSNINLASGTIKFYTNDGLTANSSFTPTERMRIDASGILLVGKTATNFGVEGSEIRGNPSAQQSAAVFTRDGQSVVAVNRLTNDGSLLHFYKDDTSMGSIGTVLVSNSRYFYIGSTANNANTGIGFYDLGIYPSHSDGSFADNGRNLGSSSVRWNDIYATNNVIQTSDRNEKQGIRELLDAEQRVATACKGLLRAFKWNSAVEEKGDEARIHFGIIAQDLQDAFTAEGLDASDYAMFINSTWTDEENGEERSRMGVRYSELLAFIISAI
jgi:hypothetical protein